MRREYIARGSGLGARGSEPVVFRGNRMSIERQIASEYPSCRAPSPDSILPQLLLEQLQNAPVLVGPAGVLGERVVLDWIHRQLPVLLAQLDQALSEAHGILE